MKQMISPVVKSYLKYVNKIANKEIKFKRIN
jgi:hypothetical protein